MFKKLKEGKVEIYVPVEKKVSKKLPVFYNPIMKFNRDISVVLLNILNKKGIRIALPLAGTGVRGVRFLKELKKGIIKEIYLNDYDEKAVKIINKNLKLNELDKDKRVIVENTEANLFLRRENGFDYIDIDPFGSPNTFLESAVLRLSRKGVLAVTATDTSALSGTFPKACLRKYWAIPLRNELMHEIGLRILIRKVQLIGAQHEKALIPIYSYSKEHYMRVFFVCEKGKTKVDRLLKEHGHYLDVGPMWLGRLWDKKIAVKVYQKIMDRFTETIADEAMINTIGFFDIHKLCKKNKSKIPKMELLIDKIKKKNKVSRTHFNDYGIRSDIEEKELLKIINSF